MENWHIISTIILGILIVGAVSIVLIEAGIDSSDIDELCPKIF